MAFLAAADSNQQVGFPNDQAATLRDLARNGASNEGNVFGDGDAQHSNGAFPNDYIFSEAYPMAGLANSSNDLDPAALLESLANFEHPPIENPAPVSNDHFASLLQAAATAGGQEVQKENRVPQYALIESSPRETSQPNGEDEEQRFGFITTRITRHKRRASDEDAEEARVREIWGPEDDQVEVFEYKQSAPLKADARANGVHSAAALFRRPSAASKKYTRK